MAPCLLKVSVFLRVCKDTPQQLCSKANLLPFKCYVKGVFAFAANSKPIVSHLEASWKSLLHRLSHEAAYQ
jgi:hypothetical protein